MVIIIQKYNNKRTVLNKYQITFLFLQNKIFDRGENDDEIHQLPKILLR